MIKKFAIPLFLAASCLNVSSAERDWENWKDGDVSQVIHDYWIQSQEELIHRKALAQLVSSIYVPGEQFLEAGCGSGLVYRELVPHVMGNVCYTGIDVTDNMLAIAHKDYPQGTFLKDDLYRLSFADNSFDCVAAFEVLGHIRNIKVPIAEMIRVASKKVIFTVWMSDAMHVTEERFRNSRFIHTAFSHEDILSIIRETTEGAVEWHPINSSIWAYIITK